LGTALAHRLAIPAGSSGKLSVQAMFLDEYLAAAFNGHCEKPIGGGRTMEGLHAFQIGDRQPGVLLRNITGKRKA
jgi:hypothetical protein